MGSNPVLADKLRVSGTVDVAYKEGHIRPALTRLRDVYKRSTNVLWGDLTACVSQRTPRQSARQARLHMGARALTGQARETASASRASFDLNFSWRMRLLTHSRFLFKTSSTTSR